MEKINEFRKDYFFLSNFYKVPVEYKGLTYSTSEAAFQAQKCKNEADKAAFTSMTPDEAKQYGRKIELRPDWEQVKFTFMKEIVYAKFSQNENIRERLLATGDAYLEEGNTWGDQIWGTVDGIGENNLGKILMEVRAELQNK